MTRREDSPLNSATYHYTTQVGTTVSLNFTGESIVTSFDCSCPWHDR